MFNFEFDIRQFYVLIVTSLAGAVGFLVRKIFTSERQIELLKNELKGLQDNRLEHNNRVDEQLTEIRNDIKNLLARKQVP